MAGFDYASHMLVMGASVYEGLHCGRQAALKLVAYQRAGAAPEEIGGSSAVCRRRKHLRADSCG